jgi:glycosyltransferase involved in cell wall biosynthesis
MKSFDILILPMPKDAQYLGMPLKLLEYLAVGRITIVAESPLIKDVFTKEFQPYYYPKNSSIGLFNSINFALNDVHLKKQILLGIRFASTYTWESRVTNVLNIVLSEKIK